MKDCPIEPKIPVYLLVGGCVGLLKLLSLLWQQFRSRHGDEMYAGDGDGGETVMPSRSSRFSDAIVSVFLVIWFVIGNVWVGQTYMLCEPIRARTYGILIPTTSIIVYKPPYVNIIILIINLH